MTLHEPNPEEEVGATNLEESVEFAGNPEPRCACILLLDTSGSMEGHKIESLNEGIRAFKADLIEDTTAAKRVEVAVVSFGGKVHTLHDFVTVDKFEPPILSAQGFTPMGQGIDTALDMIESRKQVYQSNGIPYYRPWIFLVTDGEPHPEHELDPFYEAASRVKTADAEHHVIFWAVGVDNANFQLLQHATVDSRPPVKLKGLQFKEMFLWLSNTAKAISGSRPGEAVALPPPEGWATIDV